MSPRTTPPTTIASPNLAGLRSKLFNNAVLLTAPPKFDSLVQTRQIQK